jgi:hypothetical protein
MNQMQPNDPIHFLQEAAEGTEKTESADPICRKDAQRRFGAPANHFRAPIGATQGTAITGNFLVPFCG